MPETIYERPAHYDLEHQGDEEDVRFYLELVRRLRPRQVLELGSGSGRVTLPIARLGAELDFHVVGLDEAERMLAQTREKAAALEEAVRGRLRLVQGDMRTWSGAEPFDLIIVPCSTLSHVLTLDDQIAVWSRAHANLVPGGRFVADVTMPDLAAYADSLREPPRVLLQMDVDREAPESSERLIRYRTTQYLPHLQRARIRFLYDRFQDGQPADRFVSDFESHVYFPRELELLFRVTGFAVESFWGDYAFGWARATSRQLIVVGRRPRDAA